MIFIDLICYVTQNKYLSTFLPF